MKHLPASLEQKREVLLHCRFFTNASEAALQTLATAMQLQEYERGEVLFWENDPCKGLYVLQEGLVKLFKVSPQGREFIINIKEPGDVFNEVPVFDQGTNPVNVSALQTARVWLISAATVHYTLKKHPEIMQTVIARMSEQLRNLVKMLEELSFYQVTHRLARLIYELSPEHLQGSLAERLTQEDLAARLGTVREVVARSLRQLERSGAIQNDRGRIFITDPDLLEEWTVTMEP